jgi:hypothetical protein
MASIPHSHTTKKKPALHGSTATECLSRIGASDQGLSGYNWGTIGNGKKTHLRCACPSSFHQLSFFLSFFRFIGGCRRRGWPCGIKLSPLLPELEDRITRPGRSDCASGSSGSFPCPTSTPSIPRFRNPTDHQPTSHADTVLKCHPSPPPPLFFE